MPREATVTLEPVRLEDKAALRALFDPYLIAHADLADPDREYGDPTIYDYFDAYWVEPGRRPYWVMACGRRVGFVLVNQWSPSGRGTQWAISEFCILPEERRHGLGLAAALAAFATEAGLWELQVYLSNLDGMGFWPRVIAAAKAEDREAIEQADRVVHRFRIP